MGYQWVGGSNSRSNQEMENRKVNKLVSLFELYDMLEVAIRQRVHCVTLDLDMIKSESQVSYCLSGQLVKRA